MILYDYPEIMLNFAQWVEDENPTDEEIQAELSKINLDFTETIDHIASMARELGLEADAIKQTANTLKEREAQKRAKCERLKAIAKQAMLSAGKDKIETPRNKILLQNNPPSVYIDDEKEFIEKYSAYEFISHAVTSKIDRAKVKQWLLEGAHEIYAELRQEEGLRIK